MRRFRSRLLTILITTISILAFATPAWSQADSLMGGEPHRYRVVVLADSGAMSEPSAINDKGDVVGSGWTAEGPWHALLWSGGTVTDLGVLRPGDSCMANDINNRGDVVGVCMSTDWAPRSFLWRHGMMTEIGTLGGTMTSAVAINDRGDVVGIGTTPGDEAWHSFLWRDSMMTDLGIDGAVDINNRGEISGSAQFDTRTHAYRWDRGSIVDHGPPAPYVSSYANKINDHGTVVGSARDGTGQPELVGAFVWRDEVMTMLPSLGDRYDGAIAINNRGQIIGQAMDAASVAHNVMWQHGVLVDLDRHGIPFPSTGQAGSAWLRDINDHGTIAAGYYPGDGRVVAAVFR